MKNYELKTSETGRIPKIGKVTFKFQKAFQKQWEKYPRFIETQIYIFIMVNETPQKVIDWIKKNYKNPRDFQVELFPVKDFPKNNESPG